MTLPNPLGGVRTTERWRDHNLAVTRAGEGPPLWLVHSVHAAAWSYEWRRVFPRLAERFSVRAPDLLGFGASDRPDVDYSARLYIEQIAHHLGESDEPAVLIASSLGATYAIAAAAFVPERVQAVVAIGPTGIGRLDQPGGALMRWNRSLLRSERTGPALFGGLSSAPSIRFFLRRSFADPANLDDEWVDLSVRTARQPGARFAPAAFVSFALNHDLRDDLAAISVPLLLAWGEGAKQTPPTEAQAFLKLRPDLPLVTLPGGDLTHDEHPDAFVDAVLDFVDGLDEGQRKAG